MATSSTQLLQCFPEGIVENLDRCRRCLPERSPGSIRREVDCDRSQTCSVPALKMLRTDSSSAHCKEMTQQQATREMSGHPHHIPAVLFPKAKLRELSSPGREKGKCSMWGRGLGRHLRVAGTALWKSTLEEVTGTQGQLPALPPRGQVLLSKISYLLPIPSSFRIGE